MIPSRDPTPNYFDEEYHPFLSTSSSPTLSLSSSFTVLSSSLFSVTFWTKKRILLFFFSLLTILTIPLLFLVIIPSIIRSSCQETSISIHKVQFSSPSDTLFTTEIEMKFSKGISLQSQIELSEMIINWNDEEGDRLGGNVMKLKHINHLKVTTSNQLMKASVQVLDLNALTNFALTIMKSNHFHLNMKGDAVVTVLVPTDVTLNKQSVLQGFNDWQYPITIPSLNITDGTSQYLEVTTLSNLISTSNIEIIFGQSVNYRLTVLDGVPVGIGTFPDFTLFPGNFSALSTVHLSYSNPTQYNALMYLIGNYMSGIDTPVTVMGMYLDHAVKWLEPALNSIVIHTMIPGLKTPLLLSADMYVTLLRPLHVPFTLVIANPLSLPVLLTVMDAEIYYQGKMIATVHATGLQIYIPPNGQIMTPEIYSQVDPLQTATVLDLLNKGEGLIDCYSTLTMKINDYQVTVQYNQKDVQAYIHKGKGESDEGMSWREV